MKPRNKTEKDRTDRGRRNRKTEQHSEDRETETNRRKGSEQDTRHLTCEGTPPAPTKTKHAKTYGIYKNTDAASGARETETDRGEGRQR